MKITKEEYEKMWQQQSPSSKLGRNMAKAGIIGGLICTLGQVFFNGYTALGMDDLHIAAWTSITMVCLGAVLTGLHWYDKIAKHAGAGTLVPITGFANAVVSPAMEFKAEGLVLGLAAKMFTIAGPVLVYGIAASVVYGVVLWGIGTIL